MVHSRSSSARRAIIRQVLFLSGLVVLLLAGGGYIWLQQPLEASIDLERRLAKNVGRIMMLDEVLTMSARMAAAARDPSYEARYNANVDELDRTIKATLGLVADPEVSRFVAATDAANLRLVAMEMRSFELAKTAQYDEASKLLHSEAYRADKAVYADGMGRAFARLEAITAARRRSVERWSTFLQILGVVSLLVVVAASTLDQRERRRYAAAHAAELEGTVRQRTAELQARNLGMRLVLDNVAQGFVTIDLNGVMDRERSAVLDSWFGVPSPTQTLSSYLSAHARDFAAALDASLEQLRDGFLPPDLLLDQLPRRFSVGASSYEAAYRPIGDATSIERLLVILSDVTEQLTNERAEQEQGELVALFQHIRVDRAGVEELVSEAADLVARLKSETDPIVQRRLVHTLKGNWALYGLKSCAERAHAVETELAETGAGLSAGLQESLSSIWQRAMERVSPLLEGDRGDLIEIEREELEEAIREAKSVPAARSVGLKLVSWKRKPLARRFERLSRQAQALARRLGRPTPNVVMIGERLRFDDESWQPFWTAMTHVARNALTHGIEDREERLTAGKSPHGTIELGAVHRSGRILVTFRDDGRGIQWEKVRAEASRLGLPSTKPADLVQALFADGLSTAGQVTDLAGRGIGLGALRQVVSSLQGSIDVESKAGEGTTFRISFDDAQLIAAAPAPRLVEAAEAVRPAERAVAWGTPDPEPWPACKHQARASESETSS